MYSKNKTNEVYTLYNNTDYKINKKFNIKDDNNNDAILYEIEGVIYYNTPENTIFTKFLGDDDNILKEINGKNGDLLNLSIICGIIFENASIDNDYNKIIGEDFKFAINKKSLGYVIDIKPINTNDNKLIIFFTLTFLNNNLADLNANNFINVLNNNNETISMFNDSKIIKQVTNLSNPKLYYFYEINKIYKTIPFYLCKIDSIYDNNNNILNIKINTLGLYNKWSYKINNNNSVIVNNNNEDNININLNDIYLLYIQIYNNNDDILYQKSLFIDPNTNLENNTKTIYSESNTYIISIKDDKYNINNIEQNTINLKKGLTYIFDQNNTSNELYPIDIYTTNINNDEVSLYKTGIKYYINNINVNRNYYIQNMSTSLYKYLEFTVPLDITYNVLYYNSKYHNNIGGQINIIN